MILHRNIFGAFTGLFLLVGCAVGSPVGSECKTGADCESGACNEGVCVDESGGGGESSGAAPAGGDAPEGGGGSTSNADGGSGAGGSNLCSPNEDGQVTREEVPLQAGLQAKFRVAVDTTFDTAGESEGDARSWDMSTMLDGDHTILVETMPLAGTWFEDVFPGATYAARLSDAADLMGVFEITTDELLLRGVVSPEDGALRTELAYDPAVVVLQFPLAEGNTWATNTTVTGMNTGVSGIYFEAYESVVDAHGTVLTPFGDFDVLRIHVDLTRNTGGIFTTQKTYAFVSECFGTIATIDSNLNELDDDFTDVSEIKRLTP